MTGQHKSSRIRWSVDRTVFDSDSGELRYSPDSGTVTINKPGVYLVCHLILCSLLNSRKIDHFSFVQYWRNIATCKSDKMGCVWPRRLMVLAKKC